MVEWVSDGIAKAISGRRREKRREIGLLARRQPERADLAREPGVRRGIAWFVGSAAMGALYDISVPALVVFSVALQFGVLPVLAVARRREGASHGSAGR